MDYESSERKLRPADSSAAHWYLTFDVTIASTL